ncbi:MAG: hypothetical protein WCG81_05905 [Candidatus Angelobacter sp.]
MIEGKQTEKGKTERNNHLLAVAQSSHTFEYHCHQGPEQELPKELGNFLDGLAPNDGAECKVLACKGPESAVKCLKKAIK